MSLLDTLRARDNDRAALQRQARNDDLAAQEKGFTLNTTSNKYERTPESSQAIKEESETVQMQSQLDALKATVAATTAASNANGITNILGDIAGGNWEDAINTFNTTPNLKQSLANTNLNVKDIEPINMSNPVDKKFFDDLGIATNLLEPETISGLTRAFIKVTGTDDTKRIVNTDEVIKETNSYNMMKQSQKKSYNESAREVNSILKRLTPTEQSVSESDASLKATTTEDVIGWLEANPDKTYTDYKNQGKVGRDSRGGTEKLIATYDRENPSASTEERKAFVDNLFKTKNIGVGGVREEKDVADLTRNQLKAIDLVDSTKYDSKEALKLENNIMSDLGTTKKKQVGKALEALTANHKMVKSITRILKEAEAGPVKIDKDVIANAKTYVQTIFGDDTPQAFKNIDFNTAGGLLLAGFMKDVSGTAVGVAEAERLTRLFQGGNLADETFVKEAMSAFARESEEANNILRDNNKQYIPESATRLTTYEDKVEEPAQQAIPTGTIEDGYRFLGGNPADQNNWEKAN